MTTSSIHVTDANSSLDTIPTKRDWVAPFVAGAILSLVSFGMSAYTSYNSNDKTLDRRVTTVEVKIDTQVKSMDDRLNRIENKVDRVLEKVK